MYEKILQKLKVQRGQTSYVSDRSLEDLAKSLVKIITTDELLAQADLTEAIKSIDGNINAYTAEQVKKMQDAAKKAAEDEAKKKADEEAAKKKAEKDKEKNKDVPEYIQALMEQTKQIMTQNETLAKEVLALKSEKTSNTRAEQVKKVLEGLPAFVANPIIAGFQKTNFSTEDDFTAYVKELEKNKTDFIQAAKEQGLNNFSPIVDVQKPVETGETPVMADARKLILEQREKQQKKV